MSKEAASKRSNRFEFLDATRGIAAVLVVIYHVFSQQTPLLTRWMFNRENLGAVGVYVFFFISGFIIPVSMERKSLRSFWRARCFRLLPAYWTAMAATLLCGAVGLVAVLPVFYQWHPKIMLQNALMLTSGTATPAVVGVEWTLTIELVFYMVCSVLRVTGLLPRRVLTAWGAMGLYAVLLVGAAMHVYPPHLFKGEWGGLFLAAFVGSVFFEVARGTTSVRALWLLVPVMLGVILAGLRVQYAALPPQAAGAPEALSDPWPLSVSWVIATVLFAVMFWLREREFPVALIWLGRISYSIYLFHGLVLGVVLERLVPRLHLLSSAALALGVTLGIAELSYRCIETPANALGHRRSRMATGVGELSPAA